MAVKQKLIQTQPIAYKTLENGFIRNKKSHAYLIVGSEGSPIKEVAILLAQSFLCEQGDPLACEECLTCIRVEDYNYIDFTLIDGSKESIKKEDIDNLQEDFSKTALEVAGKKVYVIHLIENASFGAINGILKFLEEPSDDIIGILTSQNPSKILPTIVSRCQMIRLKNVSKNEIIKELETKGYSRDDAQLLAQNNSSISAIEEILQDENFHTVKDVAIQSFQTLIDEPDSIHYFVQRQVIGRINSRVDLYAYLQVLETLVKDVSNYRGHAPLIMNDFQSFYARFDAGVDINKILETIMYTKGSIDQRINVGLALDRLYFEMMEK